MVPCIICVIFGRQIDFAPETDRSGFQVYDRRVPSDLPSGEPEKKRAAFAALSKHWSGRRDSNPRPSRWQREALPLSYSRKASFLYPNKQRQTSLCIDLPALD